MIKKFLMLLTLFTLFNCKKEVQNEKSAKKEASPLLASDATDKCDIPEEIRSYITSSADFELLTPKDLKLITEFIDSSICPTYTTGDFNHNGKEDIAVILRYKGYKSEEYATYIYPFLIIFNDYKDGIKPNIIYKTSDYKDESVKTVIYDQYNKGIISYIRRGKVCEKEVIDIVIPEKSSFFVYWNPSKLTYEFLNYLDENLCEKINIETKSKSILNSWQNGSTEIHIIANNISYLFHGQCVYTFPVKILNENEVELIWGEIGMDCVYEVFFDETFDLPKDKIPQKGKPFSKYVVDNGVLKVTYYYEEWVERYKKKITEDGKPFPFVESFILKKEEE